MTVSYTAEVATCTGFGCFLKLLFKWKGSIYKLVWLDLLAFLGIYFGLSLLYRFCLTEHQQEYFERISRYCDKYGTLIPVSFVLGFYVSIVVDRWWSQYIAIPWPDSIAVFISSTIQGQDEKARLMRRTIMRYVCLALTMAFTLISPRVKKRFPTYDHFIEAGLLLENERDIIVELNRNVPSYSKHWLPIVWAASIVTRARKEGKIRDDFAVKTILDELNKFRGGCGTLTSYDWISVPLVYTQVVTLAVYSYFFSCIMGRQWLRPEARAGDGEDHKAGEGLDLYFPIFTVMQFFFYMGWLKVAETLVNPFGDDDDDFELNWIVDRNLQVAYLIVDEMHNCHPDLLRDQYWNTVFPTELPHTVASDGYKEVAPHPSTDKIQLSHKQEEIVSPPSMVHLSELDDQGKPGATSHPVTRHSRKGGSVRSNESQSSSRSGSVSSLFKRVFSKGKDLSAAGAPTPGTTPSESSTMELKLSDVVQAAITASNRNLAEEAIPELDENQSTITSMRAQQQKPTAQELFQGESNQSKPIDVPGSSSQTGRFTQVPTGDSQGTVSPEELTFVLGGDDLSSPEDSPTKVPGMIAFQEDDNLDGDGDSLRKPFLEK